MVGVINNVRVTAKSTKEFNQIVDRLNSTLDVRKIKEEIEKNRNSEIKIVRKYERINA